LLGYLIVAALKSGRDSFVGELIEHLVDLISLVVRDITTYGIQIVSDGDDEGTVFIFVRQGVLEGIEIGDKVPDIFLGGVELIDDGCDLVVELEELRRQGYRDIYKVDIDVMRDGFDVAVDE